MTQCLNYVTALFVVYLFIIVFSDTRKFSVSLESIQGEFRAPL